MRNFYPYFTPGPHSCEKLILTPHSSGWPSLVPDQIVNSKTNKMKRSFFVLAMAVIIAAGFSSCTTQRGCKSTQGYIGYGK
jgi:hypothetical protein